MDERLESWIAAERLIAKYGAKARRVAEDRADELRAQGDPGAAEVWTQIGVSVREIQAGQSAPAGPGR